ncbi:hypothetical protein BaRGS_00005007 [Batillaria attramentaria]|uniref:Uncharacterized protein n=1 Tax=Batillaria attramentaria TaxID=370345 RepID=A0ABD0LW71_9CAEN
MAVTAPRLVGLLVGTGEVTSCRGGEYKPHWLWKCLQKLPPFAGLPVARFQLQPGRGVAIFPLADTHQWRAN